MNRSEITPEKIHAATGRELDAMVAVMQGCECEGPISRVNEQEAARLWNERKEDE